MARYAGQGTKSEVVRGLDVACYFHGSRLGGEEIDYARSAITVNRDHSITLQSGLTDYGQGSQTVFTLITAETLGVRPDRIHILHPYPQTAEETDPTSALSASIVGGKATRIAAEKILQMLRLAAMDLLSCMAEQLNQENEQFVGPKEGAEGVIIALGGEAARWTLFL